MEFQGEAGEDSFGDAGKSHIYIHDDLHVTNSLTYEDAWQLVDDLIEQLEAAGQGLELK